MLRMFILTEAKDLAYEASPSHREAMAKPSYGGPS